MSTDYTELMADGHRLMKAGKAAEAASLFMRASEIAVDGEDNSAALHMLGVCERSLGLYTKAEHLLGWADDLTTSEESHLKILRDISMVSLHRGNARAAYDLAMMSYRGLLALRVFTGTENISRLSDEAYASLGFAGEIAFMDGRRKEDAYDHLWEAYDELLQGNNEHYLLNTIVRLLKYVPRSRWIEPAPHWVGWRPREGCPGWPGRPNWPPLRGVVIALKEHNLRRVGEIVILTVFGLRVYDRIERLYRARRH